MCTIGMINYWVLPGASYKIINLGGRMDFHSQIPFLNISPQYSLSAPIQ